jgi:hypothetical protein
MNGNNIIHKTKRGDGAEEKAVIGKDKPQRKRTPINGGPMMTTEDGGSRKRRNRRTEQETEAPQSGHEEAIETEER